MRSVICHFVILSVLFVGLESAADVVMDGYPHGDDASHQEEFGHQLDAHEDGSPSSELDGEHCQHCCHGHSASITGDITIAVPTLVADDPRIRRAPYVGNFAQAPPTPPPNA